jgi:hypothetical protein
MSFDGQVTKEVSFEEITEAWVQYSKRYSDVVG